MKVSIPVVARVSEAYHTRTEPESLVTLARWSWRLLIAIVFIADMIAIGWGIASLMSALSSFQSDQKPQHVAAPAFDRATLSSTLDAFAARTKNYESLKSARLPLTDPGL
jgi:hypothetical protein